MIALGLVAALWQEWPSWRPGGTGSVPAASVGWAAGGVTCPDDGAVIALFGDSHVAGSRMTGGLPFGAVMQQSLSGRVTVLPYAVGGHTAAKGEARWEGSEAAADIVILAYGTNDAAPRGWLRDKRPVPVAAFRASLMRQIAKWRAPDRQVILIAPPPGGSAAIMQRLRPYRQAMRATGQAAHVPVLDPADAFADCPGDQPVLGYDALHMNAAGHQCLGEWLARQVCPPD